MTGGHKRGRKNKFLRFVLSFFLILNFSALRVDLHSVKKSKL